MMPGIVAKKVSAHELTAEVEDGWRMLNSEKVDAITFVKEKFQSSAQFTELSELDYPIKRGQAGNSGGSDIMFFDSRPDLYGQFEGRNIILSAGMRNAKLNTFDIGTGDSDFLDVSDNPEEIVDAVIEAYNALPDREGKQQRRRKTNQEWKVDRIWANALFGEDSEEVLATARRMLEYLANRRNP